VKFDKTIAVVPDNLLAVKVRPLAFHTMIDLGGYSMMGCRYFQ